MLTIINRIKEKVKEIIDCVGSAIVPQESQKPSEERIEHSSLEGDSSRQDINSRISELLRKQEEGNLITSDENRLKSLIRRGIETGELASHLRGTEYVRDLTGELGCECCPRIQGYIYGNIAGAVQCEKIAGEKEKQKTMEVTKEEAMEEVTKEVTTEEAMEVITEGAMEEAMEVTTEEASKEEILVSSEMAVEVNDKSSEDDKSYNPHLEECISNEKVIYDYRIERGSSRSLCVLERRAARQREERAERAENRRINEVLESAPADITQQEAAVDMTFNKIPADIRVKKPTSEEMKRKSKVDSGRKEKKRCKVDSVGMEAIQRERIEKLKKEKMHKKIEALRAKIRKERKIVKDQKKELLRIKKKYEKQTSCTVDENTSETEETQSVSDITSSINSEMTSSISSEVSNEISNSISSEISNEMISNSISSEISNEMISSISNSISSEISNEMISNYISSEISNEVSNEMISSISNSISSEVTSAHVLDPDRHERDETQPLRRKEVRIREDLLETETGPVEETAEIALVEETAETAPVEETVSNEEADEELNGSNSVPIEEIVEEKDEQVSSKDAVDPYSSTDTVSESAPGLDNALENEKVADTRSSLPESLMASNDSINIPTDTIEDNQIKAQEKIQNTNQELIMRQPNQMQLEREHQQIQQNQQNQQLLLENEQKTKRLLEEEHQRQKLEEDRQKQQQEDALRKQQLEEIREKQSLEDHQRQKSEYAYRKQLLDEKALQWQKQQEQAARMQEAQMNCNQQMAPVLSSTRTAPSNEPSSFFNPDKIVREQPVSYTNSTLAVQNQPTAFFSYGADSKKTPSILCGRNRSVSKSTAKQPPTPNNSIHPPTSFYNNMPQNSQLPTAYNSIHPPTTLGSTHATESFNSTQNIKYYTPSNTTQQINRPFNSTLISSTQNSTPFNSTLISSTPFNRFNSAQNSMQNSPPFNSAQNSPPFNRFITTHNNTPFNSTSISSTQNSVQNSPPYANSFNSFNSAQDSTPFNSMQNRQQNSLFGNTQQNSQSTRLFGNSLHVNNNRQPASDGLYGYLDSSSTASVRTGQLNVDGFHTYSTPQGISPNSTYSDRYPQSMHSSDQGAQEVVSSVYGLPLMEIDGVSAEEILREHEEQLENSYSYNPSRMEIDGVQSNGLFNEQRTQIQNSTLFNGRNNSLYMNSSAYESPESSSIISGREDQHMTTGMPQMYSNRQEVTIPNSMFLNGNRQLMMNSTNSNSGQLMMNSNNSNNGQLMNNNLQGSATNHSILFNRNGQTMNTISERPSTGFAEFERQSAIAISNQGNIRNTPQEYQMNSQIGTVNNTVQNHQLSSRIQTLSISQEPINANTYLHPVTNNTIHEQRVNSFVAPLSTAVHENIVSPDNSSNNSVSNKQLAGGNGNEGRAIADIERALTNMSISAPSTNEEPSPTPPTNIELSASKDEPLPKPVVNTPVVSDVIVTAPVVNTPVVSDVIVTAPVEEESPVISDPVVTDSVIDTPAIDKNSSDNEVADDKEEVVSDKVVHDKVVDEIEEVKEIEEEMDEVHEIEEEIEDKEEVKEIEEVHNEEDKEIEMKEEIEVKEIIHNEEIVEEVHNEEDKEIVDKEVKEEMKEEEDKEEIEEMKEEVHNEEMKEEEDKEMKDEMKDEIEEMKEEMKEEEVSVVSEVHNDEVPDRDPIDDLLDEVNEIGAETVIRQAMAGFVREIAKEIIVDQPTEPPKENQAEEAQAEEAPKVVIMSTEQKRATVKAILRALEEAEMDDALDDAFNDLSKEEASKLKIRNKKQKRKNRKKLLSTLDSDNPLVEYMNDPLLHDLFSSFFDDTQQPAE